MDGRLVRGKTCSTHPDITTGIFSALGVVEDELGATPELLLSRAERFVLGNTIVTNAREAGRP